MVGMQGSLKNLKFCELGNVQGFCDFSPTKEATVAGSLKGIECVEVSTFPLVGLFIFFFLFFILRGGFSLWGFTEQL